MCIVNVFEHCNYGIANLEAGASLLQKSTSEGQGPASHVLSLRRFAQRESRSSGIER